jgi:hypothetical protein
MDTSDDHDPSKDSLDTPKTLKEVASHDYKIPGISPRMYIPIFLLSLGLYILVVPNWYLPGSSDVLLFIFFSGLMAAASAASTFIGRIWRDRRRH